MSKPMVRISEPPRRPPIDLEVHPPKKLSAQEVHSSSYRLSRVPKKFNSNKAIAIEKSDSYIDNYFHNHPEEIDKTSPDEKREKLNQALQQEDLPLEDRLHSLIKLKALDQIKYGENSPECYSIILQIGVTYNRLNRQISGIRNLNRCKEIKAQCDVDPHEEEEMFIELAEAHLVLSANQYKDKKSEASKHIRAAVLSINPITQKTMDNVFFNFRRDAIIARISNAQGKHKEAIDQYNTAIQSYQTAYGTDCTPDKGYFLEEIADNADAAGNNKNSIQMKFFYYQKAYEVYTELGMDEDAERVYPKLAREGDLEYSAGEEEEEEEQQNEEGGNQDDVYMTEADSKARIEDTPAYKERSMEKSEDVELSNKDNQSDDNENHKSDKDDHGFEEKFSNPGESEKSGQSDNDNAKSEEEKKEQQSEDLNDKQINSEPSNISGKDEQNSARLEVDSQSGDINQDNDQNQNDDEDNFEDDNFHHQSGNSYEGKDEDDDFEE